ncbi:glycosyltransferase [Dankookia sp. P2]|uniref:glycosyltransferase n=1 Tax=Dankookia sp. P2 TaxID=3423955 RepID=UPI003D67313B
MALPAERLGHALLPGFRARSPAAAWALAAMLYPACILWLAGLLPSHPEAYHALVAAGGLGLLALWRWSWGLVHLARMLAYTRRTYPRLRAAAARTALPPGLCVVVTSYRMDAATNAAVYGRLLDELVALRVPAAIVACITDPADARLLRAVFDSRPGLAEGTVLHLRPQAGTGKRGAMAEALELLAALHPPPNAQVVLMDGDTLLGPGALAACCRLLASQPDIGAVTCDNVPLVRGSPWRANGTGCGWRSATR